MVQNISFEQTTVKKQKQRKVWNNWESLSKHWELGDIKKVLFASWFHAIRNTQTVLASAAHILKLERYRED